MAALAITHTGRGSRMRRLALERAMTEVAFSSRRGHRRPRATERLRASSALAVENLQAAPLKR